MLKTGDRAPDFELPSSSGWRIRPSDFLGRKFVLYFYPKDDTPGCTTEARDFTGRVDDFAAADTVVIGVSRDSLERHEKFAAKHGLGIHLLSDEDGKLCESCGVWQEKTLYGRKFMGIVRTTFLVDCGGRVARVWPKVKVKGHAEEVLAAARALD